MTLRPFKPCDAGRIASWCGDERTWLLWGGDRIGPYPLSGDDLCRKYLAENGGCSEADNFYPVTALDGDEPVGHFIIRYPGGDRRVLRFGWVIVDPALRGRNYGRTMLSLGLKLAFEIMGAEKVTIGVSENNPAALKCYLSAGFRKTGEFSFADIRGETWRVIELEQTRDECGGR